jgi:hypothetical protein
MRTGKAAFQECTVWLWPALRVRMTAITARTTTARTRPGTRFERGRAGG